MKPHYEVRSQASGVKGASKALFGAVKIHILIDARHSVWGWSVLCFTSVFHEEVFVCVYKVGVKTFCLQCPENVSCGVSWVFKWHTSTGVVEVQGQHQLCAFEFRAGQRLTSHHDDLSILWILCLSNSLCHCPLIIFDLFSCKAGDSWDSCLPKSTECSVLSAGHWLLPKAIYHC